MVEAVEQQCRCRPGEVVADSGFFSVANLQELARRGIDGYVPDSNLARELNTGQRAAGIGRNRIRSPQLHRMRQKLRSPAGRAVYSRRKAVVEPLLGVLKQQRGMRRFRTRSLTKDLSSLLCKRPSFLGLLLQLLLGMGCKGRGQFPFPCVHVEKELRCIMPTCPAWACARAIGQ